LKETFLTDDPLRQFKGQPLKKKRILGSSFVPPLVYAVLGSLRDLAVGPVSIASLILGSMLRQEVSPTKDPILFLQLAFSSTFFASLFQASLGIL
ncbi:SLC26A/SulP transporter domain, partial [Dillenia turbinata]